MGSKVVVNITDTRGERRDLHYTCNPDGQYISIELHTRQYFGIIEANNHQQEDIRSNKREQQEQRKTDDE